MNTFFLPKKAYCSFIIFLLSNNYSYLAADQQKSLPTHTSKKLYKKTVIVKNKKPEKKQVTSIERDPTKDRLVKKTIRDMTIEELLIAKEYALALGNKELAIKYIKERLIIEIKDPEQLRNLRLELADLYFEKGDMKKATHCYLEYIKFYPGSKSRDYAEYKAVLSRFYARLKPPLDQTKTRKTINLANRYLQGSELPNKEYSHEVEKIRHDCYEDLYEYERDIVEQYFNLGKLTAAQTRITSIREDFLPMLKNIEPQLIEFEGLLAQKQGKDPAVQEKVAELQQKFPTYAPKKLVVQNKSKKSHANRF